MAEEYALLRGRRSSAPLGALPVCVRIHEVLPLLRPRHLTPVLCARCRFQEAFSMAHHTQSQQLLRQVPPSRGLDGRWESVAEQRAQQAEDEAALARKFPIGLGRCDTMGLQSGSESSESDDDSDGSTEYDNVHVVVDRFVEVERTNQSARRQSQQDGWAELDDLFTAREGAKPLVAKIPLPPLQMLGRRGSLAAPVDATTPRSVGEELTQNVKDRGVCPSHLSSCCAVFRRAPNACGLTMQISLPWRLHGGLTSVLAATTTSRRSHSSCATPRSLCCRCVISVSVTRLRNAWPLGCATCRSSRQST